MTRCENANQIRLNNEHNKTQINSNETYKKGNIFTPYTDLYNSP